MAQANVISLRLHWHTVAEFKLRVDVLLLFEPCLPAVAQQVMRAQAGALGWRAF